MGLERLRPYPAPTVRPVHEYVASGVTDEIYRDIKAALQVPWVGVLMLAYARYPTFFECLWRSLKPIVESRAFIDEAAGIRDFVERSAATFAPAPLSAPLADMGYAVRELDQIRAIIEAFSHGNFPYMMIAAIARLLIEDGALAGGGPTAIAGGHHAPDGAVQFVMIEEHHGQAALRELYADIKATVGLPFVNSDYRGLARWPSYFEMAWRALKPHVGSPEYEALCQEIHARVFAALDRLPNPNPLDAASLRAAAETDAPLDEIRDVCRLFQYLLPGLTVNVAHFRRQLA
jgi:hypothetical protein